jgi:DNA-binding MarR family transcriptional regulator
MGEITQTSAPALHAALTRHTGFLLSRAGMMAQRQFAAQLESAGLSLRMWGALNVLDHEGAITQHALGICTGSDPSTIVATIDELEEKGLVERRRHPSDRRAHALHMTEAGRTSLAEGRKLAAREQQQLLAPLTEDEREQLHTLLFKLVSR